jgi:hypothetical protein
MATRVEKDIIDGTDVVVGYGIIQTATYNDPVPPATAGTTTYTTEDVVVDVEIDYSSFYERIATALETVAANSTTIKNAIDNSPSTVATFTGSISNGTGGSGTILTVSGVSGTITTGMKITGGSVLADTIITSGSGTTWAVSQSQNVPSSTLVGFSSNGYLTSLVSNISLKQTAIAEKQTTIAEKQTAMETYQKKLKELGEGDGIHFIGPYEIFGLVSIYRMMIEQAKILESTGITATPEQVTQALVEVRRISELIKSKIPKDF